MCYEVQVRHITTSTCRVEARAVSKRPLCCRGHMHFPEILIFFILNDNSLKFVPNGPIHKLASVLRHCPTQCWQMQRFRCIGSLHRRPYHKLLCIPWFSVLRSHRQDFAVNKVTMFCKCLNNELTIKQKIESHYDVNFVVTDGTAGCHQWRQIWHHNDSRFSVK